MKIQALLRVKYLVLSWFFIPLFFVGCVAVNLPQSPPQSDGGAVVYHSELTDPEAKAFFAFSRFRMLGADNRWEEAIAVLKQAISFDPESDYLQLILAKAYLYRQQPEQAVTALEVILDRTPESVAGHKLLGDVLSFQQKYAPAIDHFRHAIALTPENVELRLRLAMALFRLKHKDEAIAGLEELLEQHPEADFSRLTLARFYLDNQQEEKALVAYQQLLERQPEQVQAVLEYGKLLEQQDPAAALDLYHSFISRNPRAAAVRQQLAQQFLVQQQLNNALMQLQKVRQQLPDNWQVINQIGLIQLELENWAAAEVTFRLLLEKETQQEGHRYYLAMALSEQGKLTEAISALKPVGRDSSVYTEAVLQLGYLYKQSGQNNQAIAVLQQAIEQKIHHPDLYYYLVAFLGDREDHQEAIQISLDGVEKNPEEIQLLYQLGVLYEKLEMRQTAIATMEKILLLDAEHADALNFLAYDQAEKGTNLDTALKRAQIALARKPSGYIVDTLGWIYFKMERYPESREQLEKAAELYPDDAVIQEHLGDLYRAMKLWEKAAAVYRRALKIDPEAQQVEEKLRELLIREGH
ncbi:MAG: tetratricopeptide repeat protein [Thermodesulfobacteriota bacterium]|nr:tetratricopeptide repeat protein [Thermodesulfobacteriota bacterium]